MWLGTSAGGVERAVEWCRVAGREVYTSYAVELVWNGRELLPDGAAWDWQFLAKVLTDV